MQIALFFQVPLIFFQLPWIQLDLHFLKPIFQIQVFLILLLRQPCKLNMPPFFALFVWQGQCRLLPPLIFLGLNQVLFRSLEKLTNIFENICILCPLRDCRPDPIRHSVFHITIAEAQITKKNYSKFNPHSTHNL